MNVIEFDMMICPVLFAGGIYLTLQEIKENYSIKFQREMKK